MFSCKMITRGTYCNKAIVRWWDSDYFFVLYWSAGQYLSTFWFITFSKVFDSYLFTIYIYIYIYIYIIIIIMSRHQHGYPWSSLATGLYRQSLPAGLQGYILYRHRAAVCRFELVVLPLLDHLKGSTGVHHLWVLPYFSGSVSHVWFV